MPVSKRKTAILRGRRQNVKKTAASAPEKSATTTVETSVEVEDIDDDASKQSLSTAVNVEILSDADGDSEVTKTQDQDCSDDVGKAAEKETSGVDVAKDDEGEDEEEGHETVDGEKRRKKRRKSSESEHCECHICGKISMTRAKHQDHIRYHSARRVPCEFCNRSFFRNAPLKRHKLVFHRELLSKDELESLQKEVDKDLTCKVCLRVFKARSSLQYHSQLHKGELNFTCRTCGYQCLTRSALKQHEMTHDSTCVRCLNCHRLYKDMDDWKVHADRVHQNEGARATMNAAAFTDKNTTLRKTRCLDEEGNMRIRLDMGIDDDDILVENQKERPKAQRIVHRVTTTDLGVVGTEDENADESGYTGVETAVEFKVDESPPRPVSSDEHGIQEAMSESDSKAMPTAKKFTMFQCVPCNVVFFGKDGLVDHYLKEHEDLTRTVDIFFTKTNEKSA